MDVWSPGMNLIHISDTQLEILSFLLIIKPQFNFITMVFSKEASFANLAATWNIDSVTIPDPSCLPSHLK